MTTFRTLILLASAAAGFSAAAASPDYSLNYRGILETPLTKDAMLNAEAAQWVDGVTSPFEEASTIVQMAVSLAGRAQKGPYDIEFGASANPGPRHCRFVWMDAVEVGAVYVASPNLTVSALKPGAAGDLGDDTQWVPLQRMTAEGRPSTEPDPNGLSFWYAPRGTMTCALRFTRVFAEGDARDSSGLYCGKLAGFHLFSRNFVNISALSAISATAGASSANRLKDGKVGSWDTWSNPEGGPVISAEFPQIVTFVWPTKVPVRGLGLELPIFSDFAVDMCTAGEGVNPRDANEGSWRQVRVYNNISCQYPTGMRMVWLDFGETVLTRGLRLRIVGARAINPHNHIKGKTFGNTVAQLGEAIFLAPPAAAKLARYQLNRSANPYADYIPLPFEMPFDGRATLVVEDMDGNRVCNVASAQDYKRGPNVVWWDGSDDLGRDVDAAKHGLYNIPVRPVAPGRYRVRGLAHRPLAAAYEMSVYSPGTPPWNLADHTGGWLANHSAPEAAAFVPARGTRAEPRILLGANTTEGPDGLIVVNLEGRKIGGKRWIGGNWTTAAFIAVDTGASRDAAVDYYVAAIGESAASSEENELRVTGIAEKDGSEIAYASIPLGDKDLNKTLAAGGFAVRDGRIVAALPSANRVCALAPGSKTWAELEVPSPRGLAFGPDGTLFAVSGSRVGSLDLGTGAFTPVVTEGLDAPHGLAISSDGLIFVSDQGAAQQVRVFSSDGRLVRTIGKAGELRSGAYDELRMNHPEGMALDSLGRLWVAERDSWPKRVSVWNAETGALVKAFYGPAKYGAGGTVDPHDPTRFYYQENGGLLEFVLDRAAGTSRLVAVPFRRDVDVGRLNAAGVTLDSFAAPERAIVTPGGKKLFTNAFNAYPTQGWGETALFRKDDEGCLVPAVVAGKKSGSFVVWTDLDGDGVRTDDEVQSVSGTCSGVVFQDDLSITVNALYADSKKKNGPALRLAPVGYTALGLPRYDLSAAETVIPDAINSPSTGGNQLLVLPDGCSFLTAGSVSSANYSFCGGTNGRVTWTYPNMWPGLHAGHSAPRVDLKGRLTAPTRMLGDAVKVGDDYFVSINGNHGEIYFFTGDGLFYDTVLADQRFGRTWNFPTAVRGMDMTNVTPGDEHFWPTWVHEEDGTVTLVANKDVSSLLTLTGFETTVRLPAQEFEVTAADLVRVAAARERLEAARRELEGTGRLTARLGEAPEIDGDLADWDGRDFVTIDSRGANATFNSDSKRYSIRGAIRFSGDTLYAAWNTEGAGLLAANSGESPLLQFKTGGGLDLMLETDPSAPAGRTEPAAGDVRLLVSTVKGIARAMLYEAVVPGTPAADRIPFASPTGTVYFDRVTDVTSRIRFASGKTENYELAVPLAVLGLAQPTEGAEIRGDIGALRGADGATVARLYWSNKATAIVSDIPSEARLSPANWGVIEVR